MSSYRVYYPSVDVPCTRCGGNVTVEYLATDVPPTKGEHKRESLDKCVSNLQDRIRVLEGKMDTLYVSSQRR